MSSSSATLNAQQRIPGTSNTRALRREGKVPGTLYGHGADPVSIAVESKEFLDLLRAGGGHHLMTIVVDGKGKDSVLLRSVQRDPMTQKIVHADFQRVGSDESIRASIPLNFIGTAPGVKNSGGVLDIVLHAIEVSGAASQLPEHLEFDISTCDIGTVIHASQISLPKGFTLMTTAESVVLTLEAPRTGTAAEETVAPAAEPAASS